MARVFCRCTDIARIRPVIFPDIKARLSIKIFDLIPVGQSPFTTKAWGIAEKSSTRFAGSGIDNIVLITDSPAAEQCVAANKNPFAMRIVSQ